MNKYEELRKIDVSKHIEKKNNLSYLSWAWAWDIFKQTCPDASYKVIKSENGLPYFETHAGVIVYTQVTANGETHEMWLPVMDSSNNAMKAQEYTYTVRDWKTKQMVEKKVDAFTMFDVNKTLMRCLVKNLAMFGLGLYIYAGEDLPENEDVKAASKPVIKKKEAINDERLTAAVEKIVKGEYSVEKLKANFELTADQYNMITAKFGV